MCEAIRLTGAPLIDVSSGVEDAPGIKSVDKIIDRESLDRALVEFAIADLNVFW